MARLLTGTVTAFDDACGLGVVSADDGRTYQFHCVEIADGTRTIALEQPVLFQPLARFGRYQATHLVRVTNTA